jgi:hypothetical protein
MIIVDGKKLLQQNRTMKNLILILSLAFLNTFAFGQSDSIFFFDEFSVSINRTYLEDNNTNDGIGFGSGAYHTFFSRKIVTILFGVEFNRTVHFKEYMYEGHFANATDLTYSINSLSIPLSARLNVGKRGTLFYETGFFIDMNVGARRKGTMHTYLPDENNRINYKEFEIDEKTNISGLNYGVSIGIGIKVPISRFQLIIKPDYKFGIKALYDYQDQIYNRYFRIMLGIKI